MTLKITTFAIIFLGVICLSAPEKMWAEQASQIAAGDSFTCAITTQGAVKCWGWYTNNTSNRVTSLIPVSVTGLSSGVTALDLGGAPPGFYSWPGHACAVITGGAVKCWGDNTYGQLSDGTTTNSGTPVSVSALSSGVTALALGGAHSCALTSEGAVKCWGWSGYDQIGNGIPSDGSSTPVPITGLSSGVVALASGYAHSCVVTTEGAVKCWGKNSTGQLGGGESHDRGGTPVLVTGLSSGVAAVALGDGHSCALTSEGAVKCWGSNYDGQLGDGTTTKSSTPVSVTGLSSGVVALALGDSHSCAVTAEGAVKCWGSNYRGQLGDGTTANSSTPVSVSALSSGVVALALGQWHSCALTSEGAVKCWGANGDGQLGNDSMYEVNTPVNVFGFSGPTPTPTPTATPNPNAGKILSAIGARSGSMLKVTVKTRGISPSAQAVLQLAASWKTLSKKKVGRTGTILFTVRIATQKTPKLLVVISGISRSVKLR